MTPEEAIKELSKVENRTDIICYAEFKKANKLGIEALERLQRIRPMPLTERPIWYITELIKPLPSETEEQK